MPDPSSLAELTKLLKQDLRKTPFFGLLDQATRRNILLFT